MKRLSLIPLILILLGSAGCSDSDDGGTGPTTPVFDDVVVSLDEIRIGRDCDPDGGAGEFSYKFYVVIFDETGEIDQVLDSNWNSFSANDGDTWDPSYEASFRIERRAGMRFNVRLNVRELDGSFETSMGTFVGHAGASGSNAWQPNDSGGVQDYTLYDSAQRLGIVDWDWQSGSDCSGGFRYSVTATVVSEE